MPRYTALDSKQAMSVLELLGDGVWRAGCFARGPFDGVHGGIVTTAMMAEMEKAAPEGLRPLALRTDFLRPTPLGSVLEVKVQPVRVGRRTALFDAHLEVDGVVTARCTMTFAGETEIATLEADYASDPAPPDRDPQGLPRRDVGVSHGESWLLDVLDPRLAEDGGVWFRWTIPVVPMASAFLTAIAPADTLHGMARPGLPGPAPVAGYPNTDLAIHFTREPRGEWIGVRPVTRWQKTGIGIGFGDLVDLDGTFGHAAMGVVLLPF
ncbi:thioesterase family protein [Xanthobacter versatilis]|uniref:thioesterase family protein n=1 Tax=Xanthobacter autotrophicus (strain ATCC BAA-1158 / Py2) TaxID=78245 RepID=UPI00372C4927